MSSIERPSSDHRAIIRGLLDERLRGAAAGERMDDDVLIAAHPELPALARELRMLRLLERAADRVREEASSAGSDAACAAGPCDRPAGRAAPIPLLEQLAGYRLMGEVHRGGQGVVYQAVQESTRRTVAIKVQREGPFAGEKDRVRFEREVDILARLRHPNIVTIHDKGMAAGTTYFVMDYIDGQPLDHYLRKIEESKSRKVEIAEVLLLFIKVCDAVHAAHLRGVIHRDLKPSNILVDGAGEPFVLDFGLAKDVSSVGEATMTLDGQFVGSLPWASPEQVRGDGVDVRTDVYSLGVVLYQALTDRLPYPVTGSMRQVIERIVSAVPERPSLLRREIDVDLEIIIRRCLSKEPERRYQSAGELSRDLRHYLAGEPIQARRDSGWYVIRKSLRRHRAAVAFAVLVVLGVAVAAIHQGVQSRRYSRLALQERDARMAALDALARAEAAERNAEDERDQAGRARDDAQRDRESAEAVNRFLQDMLGAASPAEQGKDVPLQDVLDGAARRLNAGELSLPPHVESAARTTLGTTWQALGRMEEAEAQFRRALEIQTGLYGTEHPDVATSMNHLGEVRFLRGDLAAAERLFEDVLAMRRKLLGPRHADIGESLNNVAFVLAARERFEEAEALYREALDVWRAALGEDHPEFLLGLDNLAASYLNRGDYRKAEPLCREVYERRLVVLGRPDHPEVTTSRNNWGHALWRLGEREAAEALFRTNLDINVRQLGELHSNTVVTLSALAILAHEQSRSQEAEAMLHDVLDREERAGRQGAEVWGRTMVNLGLVRSDQGDLGGAEAAYRAALESHRAHWGDQHSDVATVLHKLGELHLELGDLEAADELVCQALAIDQALYGDAGSAWMATHLHHRADIFARQAAWPEAEAAFSQALEMRLRFLGPDHPLTHTTREALDRIPNSTEPQ